MNTQVTDLNPTHRIVQDLLAALDHANQLPSLTEDETEVIWQRMQQGELVVIESFSRRGHRYLLAYDSAQPPQPSASTLQDRVAEILAQGASNKFIASTLKVSMTTVANCIARLRVQCKVKTRAQLVVHLRTRLNTATASSIVMKERSGERTSPPGCKAFVFSASNTQAIVVLRHLDVDFKAVERLSRTEAIVAVGLLEGETPQDIAQRRGSSVQTVRKQVECVYRKLNAHSRTELVVRLLPNTDRYDCRASLAAISA